MRTKVNQKNLRSGQLLTPFGIGQIINFPGEVSVMICGLDLWDEKVQDRKDQDFDNIDYSLLKISEPRLEKLLNVDYFVKPFPFKTSGLKNNFLYVPSVRFPSWHHCTKCKRLEKQALTLQEDIVSCSNSDCNSKMIPVRFVAVCDQGHIQDVPFKEWVHKGSIKGKGGKHILTYNTGTGSGDLGSIIIKCSCGVSESLFGIMRPNALEKVGEKCKGHRPWLGVEGINEEAEDCASQNFSVLIRGGSNVHYSNIESALHLPPISDTADKAVGMIIAEIGIEKLKTYKEQDSANILLKAVLENTKTVKNYNISIDDLVKGISKELEGNTERSNVENLIDIRLEEYQYILKGRNSENAEFKAIVKSFENYAGKEIIKLEDFFSCVVLIEKLKETRVFTGFSRIVPDSSNREFKIQQLSKKPVKWLPAIDVYGEGIFLKFNDDKIDRWLRTYNNNSDLIKRHKDSSLRRRPNEPLRVLNSAFVMMHTFAHLLIKRLCFSCGYGSSALRERIYFSSDEENRMNGILIYTSSGSSEGSLGGLVRQGREPYLGKLVIDAIEDARWCSADPVCSDIGQKSGQGPDNVNGSACHNCCLLPETSCEEYNSLLDRACVIGTLEKPELGYFNF